MRSKRMKVAEPEPSIDAKPEDETIAVGVIVVDEKPAETQIVPKDAKSVIEETAVIESPPSLVKVEKVVAAETMEEPMPKKNEEKVISSPKGLKKPTILSISNASVKAPETEENEKIKAQE